MKRIKKNNYDGSISQGTDLMIANFEKYLKLKTKHLGHMVWSLSCRTQSYGAHEGADEKPERPVCLYHLTLFASVHLAGND